MSRTKNVFSSFGLSPETATIEAWRSDLARIVRARFRRSQMSQDQFADFLGINQSVVSKIVAGKVDSLSVEFLLRLCVKLETRGRAFWGPSPDEALVTTDVSVPTGTETVPATVNFGGQVLAQATPQALPRKARRLFASTQSSGYN